MRNEEVKVGQKVRVKARELGRWNRYALAAMDGRSGTVQEIKPVSPLGSGNIYVLFEEPAEKWVMRSEDPEMNKIPGWHFEADELELLS